LFSINARKEFSVDLTLFSSEQAVNKNPEWKLKDFLINPETLGFEVPKTVVNKKEKEEKPDYEKKNQGVFQHGMGLEKYNDNTVL
jgi:hypothetical protein